LFQDPGKGDYRLTRQSPCVDKGMNQAWMIGALDLDSQPRLRGAGVDMGAFEREPPRSTVLIIR
jgi:hypothetical protein